MASPNGEKIPEEIIRKMKTYLNLHRRMWETNLSKNTTTEVHEINVQDITSGVKTYTKFRKEHPDKICMINMNSWGSSTASDVLETFNNQKDPFLYIRVKNPHIYVFFKKNGDNCYYDIEFSPKTISIGENAFKGCTGLSLSLIHI